MKRKFLFVSTSLIFFHALNAQVKRDSVGNRIFSDKELSQKYATRNRSQKIIGSVLLAGELATVGIGLFANLNRTFVQNKPELYTYYYVGACLSLASIPFLIGSRQNKKAGELLLSKENIQVPGMVKSNQNQIAIGIKANM